MTEKKVAVCTGSGRPGGLGEAILGRLGKEGYRLVVTDVDGSGSSHLAKPDEMETVAASLRSQSAEVLSHACDVRSSESVEQLFDVVMAHYGRVDVLINNAGILRDKSFSKMTLDDFEMVVNVHLLGAAYCSHAVWPIMREQNYGRILMTTSPSGLYGNFGQTNYSAAKLGQVGLMNSMKIEGAKNNIHTNSIAPVAATRMTENLMPEEVLEKLGPELVTPAAIFLVSEDAPNGVILQAQGGQYSLATVVENNGLDLGVEATADDVAANYEAIVDMAELKTRGMLQL